MRKLCSAILTFAIPLAGSGAVAAIAKMVTVTGHVVSFDAKVVKIFSKGQISLAPRPKNVRAGEEITVTYDLEQFKKTLR